MPPRQDVSVKPAESTGPEEFGPYIVYERLGVGGMATVHRAKKRGIAGFERGVALKRMLPHLAEDADFINSFVREAKLASLLVHPNIAQIYDFGRVGAIYYIAMEHVDGFDVRKMLRYSNRHKEPLPLNVVMSILCELCDALEYAHTFVDEHGHPQGIVHRDVSPSNLIIAQSGHLKVIDFGIAKANVRQLHTDSGRVKGKLGYMSPEAVTGRAFLPASDVFSAGVVAHELLTAQPLFSAKTDYDTLIRIHEAEIPPPSQRNPNVPAALDEVVLAALSRDPERRLQSAGALREALEYVAEQTGIRSSARDVADWRTRIATTEDPWGSRTSLPNISTAGFSRALPVSSLSSPNLRPRPSERMSSSARLSQPVPQVRRITGSIDAVPVDEEKSLADLTWGSDAAPPAIHELPDQADPQLTPATQARVMVAQPPSLATPLTGAPGASIGARPRGSRAYLVLIGLLVIAAGLAVYQFVLRPKPPAPAPAPPLASLKFIVQPSDAIVEIGGKEAGHSSPFETQLEPGIYTVAVQRRGYKRWTTEITLRDAEKQTVRVALEVGMAHLSVTSQPPGLVAQLDGQQLDQVTPLELQTTTGLHQIVVTNAAGITWTQDFTADVDGKYSFFAPLATTKHAAPSPGSATSERERDRKHPGATPSSHLTATKDPIVESDPRAPEPEPKVAPPPPPPKAVDSGAPPMVTPEPPKTAAPTAAMAAAMAAAPAAAMTTAPAPPSAPAASNKPPPLVPTTAVTRLSGDLPALKVNGSLGDSVDVIGKLCIDDHGHVTSAKLKTFPEITDELQRALMAWRYKPYVNNAGQPAPACFAISFHVVFKRSG
jgi:serine/threonine protein kinase